MIKQICEYISLLLLACIDVLRIENAIKKLPGCDLSHTRKKLKWKVAAEINREKFSALKKLLKRNAVVVAFSGFSGKAEKRTLRGWKCLWTKIIYIYECEEDNGDVFMCDQVKYDENRREDCPWVRAVMLRKKRKSFSLRFHYTSLNFMTLRSNRFFSLLSSRGEKKRVFSSLSL